MMMYRPCADRTHIYSFVVICILLGCFIDDVQDPARTEHIFTVL